MPTEISGSTGVNKIQDGTIAQADFASGVGNTPSWGVKASSNQSIPNATQTVVAYGTEIWDTDNAFASNRFTVPSNKAGVYSVTVNGYMTNIDDGENFRLSIAKNGTVIPTSETKWFSSASNQEMICNATWLIQLAVGDYIEVWTYHTEGSAQDLNATFTTFSGFRLIGV